MLEVRRVNSAKLIPLIEEIIEKGGSTRITVTGMSMYPFLRDSIDSVELTGSEFDSISRGDIVLVLNSNGEYILHRVVEKGENYLILCGDAQQEREEPLYPKQVIGVVTSVWRRDRKVNCKGFGWRSLSAIWLRLLPIRYLILKVFRGLGRIIRRGA